MKVCIPVEENQGLESIPYDHFGSAPYFLIYDAEKEEVKVLENGDLHHSHGMCQPLKALGDEPVDAILVRGIGKVALAKLNQQGVKVYQGEKGNVADNMQMLKHNRLKEFTPDTSCGHHGCNH